MAKTKNTTATTQVNIPAPGTFMPPMSADENKGPKLETCDVGPFRLKGVKVDLNQYTAEQVQEMIAWARENDAYVVEDKGLFSWRKESKRDWFVLRWT
jgi:hypothetical protein